MFNKRSESPPGMSLSGYPKPPALGGTPEPPAQMQPATTPPQPYTAPAPRLKPPTVPTFKSTANYIKDKANSLIPSKYDVTSAATSQAPPLSLGYPETFGKGTTLGAVASGAQNLFKGNPGNFAGVLGAVAPTLTRTALSIPGVGLPAIAGLSGLLTGGNSFAAAKTLFGPALKKLGI